jgi:hypothetical protein
LELTSSDFALPPAEWFGALVVPPEESFNSFAQVIFAFETASVEGFALRSR